MINDTPNSPKTQTTNTVKPGSKSNYDGGFHIASTIKRTQSSASKRSSNQSFTCK